MFGDARGMEAQPLILPHVKPPDGSIHDVIVLPSMANIVRGVDASTGAALWSETFGTPINGNTPIGPKKTVPDGCVGDFPTIDCHAINDKWGELSTGVIDPDTERVYLDEEKIAVRPSHLSIKETPVELRGNRTPSGVHIHHPEIFRHRLMSDLALMRCAAYRTKSTLFREWRPALIGSDRRALLARERGPAKVKIRTRVNR